MELDVIAELEKLINDVGHLNCKLILLVSSGGCSKTQTIRALGDRLGMRPVILGAELGRILASTPQSKRSLAAGELVRDIAGRAIEGGALLLDNIELLFEPSLHLNPLDLLKRLADSRTVLAVWPGQLRSDRLTYAEIGHPEYRDFSREGVVVFEI